MRRAECAENLQAAVRLVRRCRLAEPLARGGPRAPALSKGRGQAFGPDVDRVVEVRAVQRVLALYRLQISRVIDLCLVERLFRESCVMQVARVEVRAAAGLGLVRRVLLARLGLGFEALENALAGRQLPGRGVAPPVRLALRLRRALHQVLDVDRERLPEHVKGRLDQSEFRDC